LFEFRLRQGLRPCQTSRKLRTSHSSRRSVFVQAIYRHFLNWDQSWYITSVTGSWLPWNRNPNWIFISCVVFSLLVSKAFMEISPACPRRSLDSSEPGS